MLCHFEAHYYWCQLSAGCALVGLPAVMHGQAPSALVALPVLRHLRNLREGRYTCRCVVRAYCHTPPIINGCNHLIASEINRVSGYNVNNPTLERSDYVGKATALQITNRGAVADPAKTSR